MRVIEHSSYRSSNDVRKNDDRIRAVVDLDKNEFRALQFLITKEFLPKFIAFEGCDGCGKSTLSKNFAEKYGYSWTKEPTFTSEQADSLNLRSKDQIEREIEFCIDRIKHQEQLQGWVVCDRYIWSGLAYAKIFNPSAFNFIEKMYEHPFFRKPDVYVFVNTPINVCCERGREQNEEQLKAIVQAYSDTINLIEKFSKVVMVQGIGDINTCVNEIYEKIIERS